MSGFKSRPRPLLGKIQLNNETTANQAGTQQASVQQTRMKQAQATNQQTNQALSMTTGLRGNTTCPIKLDQMQLDRLLLRNRSKEYMEAVHKLDAGGHVHNKEKEQAIIAAIRSELPEVEIHSILLGIVAKCYLGKPYEVHTLTLASQIIEHFKTGQPLPNGTEKARSLALHGGYEFIEVYSDRMCAVSSSGCVSLIKG